MSQWDDFTPHSLCNDLSPRFLATNQNAPEWFGVLQHMDISSNVWDDQMYVFYLTGFGINV
jgi:hypothetical protein